MGNTLHLRVCVCVGGRCVRARSQTASNLNRTIHDSMKPIDLLLHYVCVCVCVRAQWISAGKYAIARNGLHGDSGLFTWTRLSCMPMGYQWNCTELARQIPLNREWVPRNFVMQFGRMARNRCRRQSGHGLWLNCPKRLQKEEENDLNDSWPIVHPVALSRVIHGIVFQSHE